MIAAGLSGFILTAVLGAFLMLWAVIVIFPMLWLFYTSFKTDKEIFFSPWSLPASP